MCSFLKEEFAWKKLRLGFHKPEAFCEAQWRWPPIVFLLFRLVMSAYSLFGLVHMLVKFSAGDAPHNVMAFLTTWTYLVQTLCFLLGFLLALLHFFKPEHFGTSSTVLDEGGHGLESLPKKTTTGSENGGYQTEAQARPGAVHPSSGAATNGMNPSASSPASTVNNANGGGGASSGRKYGADNTDADPERGGRQALNSSSLDFMPWYVKTYWVLSNVCQCLPVVVTLIYWAALYPSTPQDGAVSLADLNVHGLNTVMLLLDLAVSARPARLLHVTHSLGYGLVYVVFSALYWSADHEQNVLYANVLDWNQPGLTVGVVLGLSLVALPLLQLANVGVARARLALYRRLYGEQYLDQ